MKYFLGLCLFITSIFAMPSDNPSFPSYIFEGFFIPTTSWINVRLGYEGNFVGNAKLDQCKEGNGIVDDFKVDSNSGVFVLNIKDRLDLFGSFGTGRLRADWRIDDSSPFNMEMESKYRFSKAYGARAILCEWGKVVLGAGGRWGSINPSLLRLVKNGVLIVDGGKAYYKGWQIDSSISYKVDFMIPYIGCKYSSMRGKIRTKNEAIAKSGNKTIHMKNRKNFGCILGCALTKGKYFGLNVEVRLVDEEAITIGGEFRF